MKNSMWGKRVLAVMATATLAMPLIAGCTASEAKDTGGVYCVWLRCGADRMTVTSVSNLPMLLN